MVSYSQTDPTPALDCLFVAEGVTPPSEPRPLTKEDGIWVEPPGEGVLCVGFSGTHTVYGERGCLFPAGWYRRGATSKRCWVMPTLWSIA